MSHIKYPMNLDFHYVVRLVSVPASANPSQHEDDADQRFWYHLHTGKDTNWQHDRSVYPLHCYIC